MSDARILAVNGDDLLALKDEVVAVHRTAFGAPPTSDGPAEAAAFEASLKGHIRKPGVRAWTACAAHGRLVAFVWVGGRARRLMAGHRGRRGERGVRRRWFADCFELVVLAVLAGSRRAGIGPRSMTRCWP